MLYLLRACALNMLRIPREVKIRMQNMKEFSDPDLPHRASGSLKETKRNWWLVAVGSSCRLAVVAGWQLVAAGGWRLVVGGWWSLGAVLKGGP